MIIERLRNELQEYGALLGLFEEQQKNLLQRDANAVVALASSIEDQVRVTQGCRDLREAAVRQFALDQNRPATSSVRQLIPLMPLDVQPLFEALVTEINHLIHRIRRGARQNQQLLSRTVEAHEEAIRTLRPDLYPKTYSPRGAVGAASSTSSAWQATG
jgi:flagellar biosynthesis/type III secretory pathway chaperone